MSTHSVACRRMLATAVALIAVAAAGCSSSDDAEPPVTVTADDGSFSAEFPNQPKKDVTQNSTAGIQTEVVQYASQIDDGTVNVGYSDFPVEVDEAAALDGAAKGSVSSVNGTIVSLTDTTYLGKPAKDVEASVKEGKLYERIFFDGQRLYIIIGGSSKGRPPAYDRVLETFQLL